MDNKVLEWMTEENEWLNFAVETQIFNHKPDPSVIYLPIQALKQ
jgi:hypothetical protein